MKVERVFIVEFRKMNEWYVVPRGIYKTYEDALCRATVCHRAYKYIRVTECLLKNK